MKGAAVSDLHLGFRAYSARIVGRNAREVDVERAWAAAVDVIVGAQPDLVTIAGDVFHVARPSNHALKAWREGIRRIVGETRAHVVAIPGNHEASKTAEVLSPIVIPDDYERVHIRTEPGPLLLDLASGERVWILCIPHVALGEEAVHTLQPDPSADVSMLLIHAAVQSSAVEALPRFYAGPEAFDAGAAAERVDVVAAGDFHEYRRLHPDRIAFYSGSIERTSSNIWEEEQPKGAVLFDTRTGEQQFRPIETRAMYDLPWPELVDSCAEGVNHFLALFEKDETLDNAIVRFLVPDFPRGERTEVDWKAVHRLKRKCLHFQLDLRWATTETVGLGDRRERRARTMADEARDFFAGDPVDVRDLASRYLELEVAA